MMVDASVCFDEALDTLLVELIEFVDPGPGRQCDAAVHTGVGRQYDLFLILFDNGRQLRHQVFAAIGAVVLDYDTAVLEVVNLLFVRYRFRVDAP